MPSKITKSKDIIDKSLLKNKFRKDLNISLYRKKIDKIDIKLHDLIKKRAIYVKNIAKEKKKNVKGKANIYRPSREHEIFEDLLRRHKGDFPLKVLIKIWRNLIGGYISLQGNFKISYDVTLETLVKDYFGVTMVYKKINSIDKSLNQLNRNGLDILVVPFPNNKQKWWLSLTKFKSLFIIGSISESIFEKPKAVILGKQDMEYTKKNNVIYMITLEHKKSHLLEEYIKQKKYILISKGKVDEKHASLLFSILLTTREEANHNLYLLKNSEFKRSKIRIIGTIPYLSEKELNARKNKVQ